MNSKTRGIVPRNNEDPLTSRKVNLVTILAQMRHSELLRCTMFKLQLVDAEVVEEQLTFLGSCRGGCSVDPGLECDSIVARI